MAEGPKDEEGGFLNRWSQRKQKAVRVEEGPAEDAADRAAESDAPKEEGLAAPAEPELTEEELASLPSIEDLTPGSDIRAFMRPGVPKGLRNAALRKMWLITPAIRDHLDPAVVYAWDWNTPGGVPGDGAAPSPERAAQMLRDLFKPRNQEAHVDEAETSDEAPAQKAASAQVPSEEVAESLSAESANAGIAPNPVHKPGALSMTQPPREPAAARRVAVVQPAARRHGGALPK